MEYADDGAAAAGCAVYLVVLAVFSALFGFVGYAIGKGKGQGGLGFVLGFILGILGIIIIALIPGSSSAARPRRRVRRPGTGGRGRLGRR